MVILAPRNWLSRSASSPSSSVAAISDAAGGPAIGGQKPHRGQEQLALARTAFAHHAQAGAFLDVEAHLLDRMHIAVLRLEVHVQVADFEQRGHQ